MAESGLKWLIGVHGEKGKLINTYDSIKECARLKGVHKNKIRKAVRAGIMYDNKLLTCAL